MLARMMNDFAPLMRLHNDMNQWFESFFEAVPALRGYAAGYPALNLWDDGENAYVEAELPGLSMDDVELYAHENELTITGQRKLAEVADGGYHRRERAAGKFSRTVTLPWRFDADKVRARLTNGVLTVTLPKCAECKPKKVKVLPA
jgi:HSP20 family protein